LLLNFTEEDRFLLSALFAEGGSDGGDARHFGEPDRRGIVYARST